MSWFIYVIASLMFYYWGIPLFFYLTRGVDPRTFTSMTVMELDDLRALRRHGASAGPITSMTLTRGEIEAITRDIKRKHGFDIGKLAYGARATTAQGKSYDLRVSYFPVFFEILGQNNYYDLSGESWDKMREILDRYRAIPKTKD